MTKNAEYRVTGMPGSRFDFGDHRVRSELTPRPHYIPGRTHRLASRIEVGHAVPKVARRDLSRLADCRHGRDWLVTTVFRLGNQEPEIQLGRFRNHFVATVRFSHLFPFALTFITRVLNTIKSNLRVATKKAAGANPAALRAERLIRLRLDRVAPVLPDLLAYDGEAVILPQRSARAQHGARRMLLPTHRAHDLVQRGAALALQHGDDLGGLAVFSHALGARTWFGPGFVLRDQALDGRLLQVTGVVNLQADGGFELPQRLPVSFLRPCGGLQEFGADRHVCGRGRDRCFLGGGGYIGR